MIEVELGNLRSDVTSFLWLLGCKLSHVNLDGLWFESDALHVGAYLRWDLLEYLFSQISSCHACVELHELHDVSHASSSSAISQNAIVTIELLHCGEVSISHTNDND